jgi:hypothetical protein
MATEPLSTRISTELMAQVRAEIENSQTNLTATVTRLLTAGLAAEATSALFNSRLEAADAELARLKAANSSTSSALSVPSKVDNDVTVFASPYNFNNRFDDPYFGDRQAGRTVGIRAIVADRQRLALRGVAVGAALFMIALVPMPYDWWFPQLIAKASMGGSGIDPGARLVGYDNGIQMLDRVCPMFVQAMAEYEADNRKAKAEEKRKSSKSGSAKRKTARRTARGQQ